MNEWMNEWKEDKEKDIIEKSKKMLPCFSPFISISYGQVERNYIDDHIITIFRPLLLQWTNT